MTSRENNGDSVSKQSNISDDETTEEEIERIKSDPGLLRAAKRGTWKNLLLICLAFLGNFTAFNGASVLQSSLNADGGLGTASLAIIYGSLIVSAMFAPTIVIKHLGCKWTIFAAILGYVTYSLANFYPSWYTLVPSSIIVGFSAAPLWSAKSAYLTTMASRYARLTGETNDAVVNRFFGVFFLFFQFTFIIGNLISSFVLSSSASASLAFPTCYNETYVRTYCGASECPFDDFENVRGNYSLATCNTTVIDSGTVPDNTIYLLMGIYAGVGLLGAAVTGIFVDPIRIRKRESRNAFALFVATFEHMKDKRQLLLIPITMYSGFEQAFLTGDYTKSFITCPLGVNWVGFVLICYGACDSLFSFIFGRMEKYTGRIPLFSMATAINIALIVTFQIWVPYPNAEVLFFLLAGFWGVADAVWQTQLNALYGVLFLTNQEASFANYRLWESLGFVIAFAYQNFICVNAKLWVVLGFLLVGMAGYIVVEYQQRRGASKTIPVDEELSEHHQNNAYVDDEKSASRITEL